MISTALLDDDPLIGAALACLVREAKVHVVSVSASLDAGIEAVVTHLPDAVLCDVMLDNEPAGLDLPGRLGSTPAAGTPVLLLSSYGADYLLALARASGAAGYLTKSAAPETLIAALHLVVAGGTSFPRQIQAGDRSPSPREIDVIRALADGHTTTQAAHMLGITPSTFETHVRHLVADFGARNRPHLVAMAARNGWITELPIGRRGTATSE